MKKIAVAEKFYEPHHIRQIDAAAAKHGYTVDYYLDGVVPRQHAAEYEILFGAPDPAILKEMASLKWFCSCFAGVEKYVDDALYPSPDVLLSNSAGAYGVTIAEHIIMVTLMLLRQMPAYQADMARDGWVDEPKPIRSIFGSRVTVLGTGNIGTTFAHRARGLGAAHITGVCRSGRNDDPVYDEVLPISRLEEALPETDLLVMALPGTPETAHILNRERISLLPAHAYVVNVGRGTAIDQEALADALNADRLAGAALDVMDPEPLPMDHFLRSAKNLLLTPHISGNMALGYTRDITVGMFCEDLANYAAGRPLAHLVDRKLGY